jgi:Protein of unknown function (DUF4236)
MGLFFRKSIGFGPVRVNLSKRGVGLSVGIPGLRVGTQAGRKGLYVRGGTHGVYFRQRVR